MSLHLLTFMTLAAVALPAWAQIEVRLQDFVEAPSRQVRLADIATLHSDSQQMALPGLGQVMVATIAHVNQAQRIDAKQLERLIVRQQPALRGQIQLKGAPATTVILPGESVPAERIMEVAKAFLKEELSQQPYPFSVGDASFAAASVVLPKGKLQLKPKFLGASKPASRMHVVVDMFVDNHKVDSVTVGVDVDMTMPALRLLRAMNAGEALQRSDYELQPQSLRKLGKEALVLDPKMDGAAFRLRKPVAAGGILYREDVEPMPYVERNQKVLAELKKDGIVIEKNVVAQMDGQLGQVIKVADSQSVTTFSAKVVAHGRVEVK